MLHVGLDLSRNRLDVCLLSDQGEIVEEFAAPSDHEGFAPWSPRCWTRRAGARGY